MIGETEMVKVKTYKVGARGKRAMVITVPPVWLDDNNIKNGDSIDFYRPVDSDLLVLRKGGDGE